MDQKETILSLEELVGNDTSLEILMQVDKFLDEFGIYAYKNWMEGEIVSGPNIERHWVTVTLMYPYEKMPDPSAVERIQNKGGQVYYAKDEFISAAKLVTPDDIELTMGDPRSPKPMGPRAKKVKKDVWLVTLELPRLMINKVSNNNVEVELEKQQAENQPVATQGMENEEMSKMEDGDV